MQSGGGFQATGDCRLTEPELARCARNGAVLLEYLVACRGRAATTTDGVATWHRVVGIVLITERRFDRWHTLPLPRAKIRVIVSELNSKLALIGEVQLRPHVRNSSAERVNATAPDNRRDNPTMSRTKEEAPKRSIASRSYARAASSAHAKCLPNRGPE